MAELLDPTPLREGVREAKIVELVPDAVQSVLIRERFYAARELVAVAQVVEDVVEGRGAAVEIHPPLVWFKRQRGETWKGEGEGDGGELGKQKDRQGDERKRENGRVGLALYSTIDMQLRVSVFAGSKARMSELWSASFSV